jgi:hypothetical protein
MCGARMFVPVTLKIRQVIQKFFDGETDRRKLLFANINLKNLNFFFRKHFSLFWFRKVTVFIMFHPSTLSYYYRDTIVKQSSICHKCLTTHHVDTDTLDN